MSRPERVPGTSSRSFEGRGTVTAVSWPELLRLWRDSGSGLDWNCVFMTPVWLKAWWESFGGDREPCLCTVTHGSRTIGAAPLIIEGETARLIGDDDLCDFRDFIIVPGEAPGFFRTLISHLKLKGIRRMELGRVRAGSPVLETLKKESSAFDCTVTSRPAEPVYFLSLPRTWDEYLALLSRQERREIRRKIRRLEASGAVSFRTVTERDEALSAVDVFIDLFRKNRPDKARFMNDDMACFFRNMTDALSAEGLLRLSFLDIDGLTVAATVCLEHDFTVFLYNNGYDQRYRHLSVGLLSKVFSIRDSIDRGRRKFDFLKGREPYKRRLGGRPLHLYECTVSLK